MEDKKRVLIIENHPDNGRILADHFCSMGYEAIWTQEAETALESSIHFQPNIIILEMRVAGINGINMLEALKFNPGSREIPVICMSADTTQREIDRAKGLGAVAFIAKPCSEATLVELVEIFSRPSVEKATALWQFV